MRFFDLLLPRYLLKFNMRKISNRVLLFTLLLLFTASLRAQVGTPDGPPESAMDEEVVEKVDELAQFPGGEMAMLKFIQQNLVYPKAARKDKIEGRVVVEFVVRPNGSITDIKILKSIGEPKHGIDEAVIDLIESMPRWKPGMTNGKPVAMRYRLPIRFSLN